MPTPYSSVILLLSVLSVDRRVVSAYVVVILRACRWSGCRNAGAERPLRQQYQWEGGSGTGAELQTPHGADGADTEVAHASVSRLCTRSNCRAPGRRPRPTSFCSAGPSTAAAEGLAGHATQPMRCSSAPTTCSHRYHAYKFSMLP
jgi:hypothetical protein